MNFEELRKIYTRTTIPSYLKTDGWHSLSQKINTTNQSNLFFYARSGIVFTSIILVLIGSVAGAAQAAKPGQSLYPIKLFSEDVLAQITGKVDFKIENRAKEVIESIQDSHEQQQEALEQFKEELEDAKENAQEKGKQEEFKKTLESQEVKLLEVQEEHPDNKGIETAIEQTQKVRGEVKGKSEEKKPEDPGIQGKENKGNGKGNPNK